MKRIATLAVILMLGLTASAHSIRYFTESQAVRTVRYLGAQNEMMIYCGYDYEIETYVLINEVWMERINSAYYEIWVFGYDAYTGDEVYMPLDLGCVWLYSAGRMYNAAQYLRFHTTARMPSFTWYVPAYHPYTRIVHRPGYVRSYHYDVHRYGWMPPAYHHGPGMPPPPLPPYYMRQPGAPAPRPSNTWTPGVDRPVVSTPSSTGRTGTAGRVITGNSNTGGSDGVRTGNNNGSSRGTSTGTSTGSSRGTSTGTSTGSSRGTSTGTSSSSRGTSTGTSTGSSRGTSTGTSGSSRGTSTGSSGSSRGTTTGTTPTRSNTTATSSRSTSTDRSAATSAETSKPKATTSRGTQTSSSSSRGTSTGSSRSRGTSTGTSTGSRGTNSRSNSRTR